MPENGLLGEPSPVIRRAIALLDGVYEALADPTHWCKGAYAKDAEGDPIEGPILEVVEGSDVASRCVFGELLHQGLLHGYRIELATHDYAVGQVTIGVSAAASWGLAASVLTQAALEVDDEREREIAARKAKLFPGSQPFTPGEFVLRLIAVNDRSGYEVVISSVVLAAEMLRAELDRRAQERAQ